jgi:hypothetical protein
VAQVNAGGGQNLQAYLDRLMKMIPTEVVGLYLVGSGVIAANAHGTLAAWTVVCVVAVIVVRAWGSQDPASAKSGPDWTLVLISTIAFVIWVYSIGGVFTAYGIDNRPWSSLLVLAWTFFVPIIYKGV